MVIQKAITVEIHTPHWDDNWFHQHSSMRYRPYETKKKKEMTGAMLVGIGYKYLTWTILNSLFKFQP